jgi:hypothetical protein
VANETTSVSYLKIASLNLNQDKQFWLRLLIVSYTSSCQTSEYLQHSIQILSSIPHLFVFNDYGTFWISVHSLHSLKLMHMPFSFTYIWNPAEHLQCTSILNISEVLLTLFTWSLCKCRRDRFLPVTCALYFQQVCRHQFSKNLTKTAGEKQVCS